MNNKDFILALSNRLECSPKETSYMVASFLSEMVQQLEEGNVVYIQNFGTFEVKKKIERISINPVSKQRMLVPPKLVLFYKPCSTLKDKFK